MLYSEFPKEHASFISYLLAHGLEPYCLSIFDWRMYGALVYDLAKAHALKGGNVLSLVRDCIRCTHPLQMRLLGMGVSFAATEGHAWHKEVGVFTSNLLEDLQDEGVSSEELDQMMYSICGATHPTQIKAICMGLDKEDTLSYPWESWGEMTLKRASLEQDGEALLFLSQLMHLSHRNQQQAIIAFDLPIEIEGTPPFFWRTHGKVVLELLTWAQAHMPTMTALDMMHAIFKDEHPYCTWVRLEFGATLRYEEHIWDLFGKMILMSLREKSEKVSVDERLEHLQSMAYEDFCIMHRRVYSKPLPVFFSASDACASSASSTAPSVITEMLARKVRDAFHQQIASQESAAQTRMIAFLRHTENLTQIFWEPRAPSRSLGFSEWAYCCIARTLDNLRAGDLPLTRCLGDEDFAKAFLYIVHQGGPWLLERETSLTPVTSYTKSSECSGPRS